jgi:glutathione synthase/RimK-type ligase-like ATP-grasp enzyme
MDKDFTYKLLKDLVKIPSSIAYLDPNVKEKNKKYLKLKNIQDILNNIQQNFTLPLIIKRNRGCEGNNVFLCKTPEEISEKLEIIFNQNSKNYDYIALAQEFIQIEREFRVVVVYNQIELIYEKDNHNADFVGNLSPLHYENSKAVIIQDSDLKDRITKFINPILTKLDLNFVGLDITLDKNGELFLIELNSNPGFKHFVDDNGEGEIVKLYIKALQIYNLI